MFGFGLEPPISFQDCNASVVGALNAKAFNPGLHFIHDGNPLLNVKQHNVSKPAVRSVLSTVGGASAEAGNKQLTSSSLCMCVITSLCLTTSHF